MGLRILLIVVIVAITVSPLIRCIVSNLGNIYFYGLKDVILYFKDREWEKVNIGWGITCYIGMFGHGKSLSMCHNAQKIYDQYGDKVRFISNIHLKHIPYIELTNFNQLVEIADNPDDRYEATVVLIDEIEALLSHRNFANFPLTLLNCLMQQRKLKLRIYCSAQRWFTVDKIWLSITTDIYDCNKYWRFQHMVKYDAWDYENAMNFSLIRPISNIWWFVKNKDYDTYDTSQMISRQSSEDFLSNEESIVRTGLDNMSNPEAVKRPKKKKQERRKGW